MTKETANRTFEMFNRVFKTGIAQRNFEFEVITKSGKIVYGDSTIHLRYDDKGNKIGFSAFTRDITEKKIAEQKLIESEKQFRSIFESIPDIYFLVSGDSTIIEYKGKQEDLYLPPELFLGKKMKDILPQEVGTIAIEAIQKTLQTKEPTILDYSLTVRGENRFYEARVLYYNSDRVIIFIREITDRKKAELIIQEEFSKLKELEEIRKDLISRVSHELKTPLIPVISGTELISTVYKDQIGEQAKDIVEMIHNGGLRLKELIEKLVSVSRIEYKKLILNKEKTDLCELIKKSAADMKYILEIRYLNLSMNIPEELYLEIDKIRIEEVITNFLSNAIKNTPPDGKIIIDLKEEQGWAILTVADTGVGLTEEEMKILFTRFGKIDRYKEGLEYLDIKGSGLGLYICKEIIDLHGGQIWAQSEGRNKGSAFFIKLPIM
jgi:PAS domain S-box-containing protein